jgi:DNA-binding MarR family transcriptional regulator
MLIARLNGQIRRLVSGAVLNNQRIASSLGINATDLQLLNILETEGGVSPKRLADRSGLTTGGITVAVDRLEKARFIKRERHPTDRRSVIIRALPEPMTRITSYFEDNRARTDAILSEFGDRDLEVLGKILDKMLTPTEKR